MDFKEKRSKFNISDLFTKPVPATVIRNLLDYLTGYKLITDDGTIGNEE